MNDMQISVDSEWRDTDMIWASAQIRGRWATLTWKMVSIRYRQMRWSATKKRPYIYIYIILIPCLPIVVAILVGMTILFDALHKARIAILPLLGKRSNNDHWKSIRLHYAGRNNIELIRSKQYYIRWYSIWYDMFSLLLRWFLSETGLESQSFDPTAALAESLRLFSYHFVKAFWINVAQSLLTRIMQHYYTISSVQMKIHKFC